MAETSAYKEYVAGLLAGVATVVTGHPFDTVKFLPPTGASSGQGYYSAAFDGSSPQLSCLPQCNVKEEINGGQVLNCTEVMLQKHNTEAHGMKYRNGLHCTARIVKIEGEGLPHTRPQPQVIIPSAAYGGAIISFVLCPSELVKCRMQVQGTDSLVPKSSRYSSPLDCALKTMKTEGVTGIFRGGLTTLLRESLGNAVFFSVYENVRYYMHLKLKAASSDDNYLIDVGTGIVSGGLGGVAFWSAVLPLDVAKTIIQTSSDKSSTKNPFQILKSIYGRSGLRGCYTGLGPTIARAFPANAAAIVTWELAAKLLGVKRE